VAEPVSLAAAAASFAAGATDSATFAAAFADASVYALRPPPPAAPGLLAVGPEGTGHVVAFSSLPEVAAYAGECDWLRTSGGDLLALVPDGYGLLLDPAGAHPLALPPTALRRGQVEEVARR
jgi:hypothetical protein